MRFGRVAYCPTASGKLYYGIPNIGLKHVTLKTCWLDVSGYLLKKTTYCGSDRLIELLATKVNHISTRATLALIRVASANDCQIKIRHHLTSCRLPEPLVVCRRIDARHTNRRRSSRRVAAAVGCHNWHTYGKSVSNLKECLTFQ